MNKIYWGKDEIVMLTDHLNAVSHRHLMLQLFLGLEDDVKIHIRGRSVTESCVITGNDVAHSFFAKKAASVCSFRACFCRRFAD